MTRGNPCVVIFGTGGIIPAVVAVQFVVHDPELYVVRRGAIKPACCLAGKPIAIVVSAIVDVPP